MQNVDTTVGPGTEFDFEILETSEATAMEEMGASSTIAAGSTCSRQPVLPERLP
ncbi:thiopeptide-type bacteriocin [[Empedobacter] haloabium]|uniref:Thiopeptide-type bacteriocin n=1 Tax=[Empedobacter] haloabium TaxID=592317 RepID=A0ABZ1UMB9_9BURK